MARINPALKAYAEANGFAWLDMGERFLDKDGEISPITANPVNRVNPV